MGMKEFSLTSPLAIAMLLHFYSTATKYRDSDPEKWPNAQRSILEQFLRLDIVVPCGNTYKTTHVGDAIAENLQTSMAVCIKMART